VRQHHCAWLRRQEPDPPADGSQPEPLPDELLVERFHRRHADRPVWAIRFRLDTSHRPRRLHRQSERGYTSNERDAVPEEPEAVDAATLARFADDAHERDTLRRGWLDQQQLDERMRLEQQLTRAREHRLDRAQGHPPGGRRVTLPPDARARPTSAPGGVIALPTPLGRFPSGMDDREEKARARDDAGDQRDVAAAIRDKLGDDGEREARKEAGHDRWAAAEDRRAAAKDRRYLDEQA
jgi:hypothetical protein